MAEIQDNIYFSFKVPSRQLWSAEEGFQRKFSRETTDMKNNGKALPYSSLLNNFLEARENVPDNDNNNMQSDLTCMWKTILSSGDRKTKTLTLYIDYLQRAQQS